MNKYGVIVAGGSGQRMGTDLPKQFLLLKGKPLLHYTIQSFLLAFEDIHLILVLPPEHLTKGKDLLKNMELEDKIEIIAGGTTRFHSVKNGLSLVTNPSI